MLAGLARRLNIHDSTVQGLLQLREEYERTKCDLINQEPVPHNIDELLTQIDRDLERATAKLVETYK